MKHKFILTSGILTALLITGCQSGQADPEYEELKEQIAQLQQQIDSLEQQLSNETPVTPEIPPAVTETSADGATDQTEAAVPETEGTGISSPATTQTIEELTAMVSSYEEKAEAAVPSGTASEDMEQFLALKQEEKQIDDALDLHEDELEYLYRSQSLSRDEYRRLEQELDRLEDRLDAAEDRLEYTFGIDD